MIREDRSLIKNVDSWLILLYLILVFAGWFNIYAAVYDENYSSIFDINQRYGKQLIFIIAGIIMATVVLLVDMRFFMNTAYLFYGLSIILLIAVLVVGAKISGARSWFQFAGMSLQPSEIAKFATCLALAKYLNSGNVNLKLASVKFMSLVLIFLPSAFIILQPDMGSAIVFAAFVLVLYREGLPGWYLWAAFIAIVIFVLALALQFWALLIILGIGAGVLIYLNKRTFRNIASAVLLFAASAGFGYGADYAFQKLEPHQKDRINVLLGKEVDLRGVGYNVNQSKIAIGSGGFAGKGYLQGTQTKFNFVPEQSTDFIFCTVGEEWGFLGSTVVLGLFLALILRIIYLAEKQRTTFARIYGYGVASILFFHVLVNIGMAIGLLPVIGIPLPFFSYGGSSLWAFTLLLFVFIKQDASRITF
ncbi:MAG: rod shape-determining protein RodA [Bacteroidales bacterium]|jgi:rod shape determining protein RodA|nr:rod shape-determining protein RodA [Bacteroidales bacterium]